jgi:two-component system cell cycle sensor histidine kinase/response regulator CckA
LTELDQLRRDNAVLAESNERLLRRAVDAEQTVEAFARGEVDAVASEAFSTPVMLRVAQEQVRESRQLLRAIFDGALDAIILVDDDGTFADANPAASKLFGLPHVELLGCKLADFTSPGQDVHAELQKRSHMVAVVPVRLRDGTVRTLELSAVANVIPGKHLKVLRDVSDRVAAEEALRRNEALFRAVIEKSSEVISLTTRDGTTRYLTPAAWRLLGYAEDDGRNLRDQVIREDRVLIASELERLIRTGDRDMAMDIRVLHRDGSVRWIESTGTNLLDDPDVGAIVGNYRDITARKHADEELRASRDTLEEAQSIARLGSWSKSLRDEVIIWSNECYRIFGLEVGSPMSKRRFYESVHPADRERVRSSSPEELASGESAEVEYRVQLPDGRIRWVLQRMLAEQSPGRPTRVRGTIQDVTERRDAVEALQASETRYRRIVENTSEGVWMYDAHDITSFMNERMAQMLGCSISDAVGQPIYMFIDKSKQAEARRRIANRHLGQSDRSDFALRRHDGTELRVSIQANPLFDARGSFEGVVALLRDVTAERHADETRARLAAIVESSADAILGIDLDGVITSWNLGAEDLYQYRADEMLGRPVFDLEPPSTANTGQRAVETGDETRGTYTCERRRKDGSLVEVAVTVSPVRDAMDKIIGVSSIARDLTQLRKAEDELRRTETQLRQAQKMEAVGRLAGGIAHDFNNLLSVILSYSEFAIEDLKPGDPLRDDMIQIDQAGKQAAGLTRQLLAFSRQQVLQPRVIELPKIILPMERMLRRVLGEDVALTVHDVEPSGRVLVDPGQIEQVVMNLAVNARDAMPDGGTLAIDMSDVRVHVGAPTARSEIPAGDYVMLSITDTGSGMDAATCTRIFEPFFTTKEIGKGTGLGLSTVFGIIQQSGGYVDVTSELGRGTTFRVYLPCTDQVAAATALAESRVLRGSETILLVEDEEQVRTVACSILRRNGYTVLETSNAGEAFLVSKDHPTAIDLLLTDVVMPRMSGRKLADELATQRPTMKVLYASGYTDAIIEHGVLAAGPWFVQKPFTPDLLLRHGREVWSSD